MIDGGHLVAKMLQREKIDVVFTLCGGHSMPIYNGLLDEGIRVVDLHHEQAAAVQRARASGKPACVNVRIDAEANAAVSANSMVV